MGTFVTNYQNRIHKINYWTLLFFVFFLPLSESKLPPIMAFWLLTWLLEGDFKNRFKDFDHKYMFTVLCIYFFLTFIFAFRATDNSYGLFHVQHKLSLIFYPLVFLGSNQMVKKNLNKVLFAFVLGNLVAIFYDVAIALISNTTFENGSYFIKYWVYPGHEKELFWNLVSLRCNAFSYCYVSVLKHPTYFSIYLTFSICILIYLMKEKFLKKIWVKIAFACLIAFFIFFIYLLQSRSGIISLVLVGIIIASIEMYKIVKRKRLAFTISLALLLFIFFIFHSRINTAIGKFYNTSMDNEAMALSDPDSRLQSWYASIQVIKENFWLGTGSANLADELEKKYRQLGFNGAASEKLNCHNQYLESFAGLGVFGFLSLIFILCYSLIISIKNKNYLLFFLFFLLAFNFLFESMLNRMAGVLFMMLFISIFIFIKVPKIEHQQIEPLEK
jgi:O-antigen ligase